MIPQEPSPQGILTELSKMSQIQEKTILVPIPSPRDYEHCAVACFGPYTAANAKALGVSVAIVSQTHQSFAGFVEAIATFLNLE